MMMFLVTTSGALGHRLALPTISFAQRSLIMLELRYLIFMVRKIYFQLEILDKNYFKSAIYNLLNSGVVLQKSYVNF